MVSNRGIWCVVIYRESWKLIAPLPLLMCCYLEKASNKSGVPVGYKLRGFFSKTSKFFSKISFYIFEVLLYLTTDFLSKSSFYISRETYFQDIPPKNGSLMAINEEVFFYALTFALFQGFFRRGYCKHTLNFWKSTLPKCLSRGY